jgi:hypothetical protein
LIPISLPGFSAEVFAHDGAERDLYVRGIGPQAALHRVSGSFYERLDSDVTP